MFNYPSLRSIKKQKSIIMPTKTKRKCDLNDDDYTFSSTPATSRNNYLFRNFEQRFEKIGHFPKNWHTWPFLLAI